MKAQKPAEGIMQTHEYGFSKVYKVACSCTNHEHEHTVDVEADEYGVNVLIYTTVKTVKQCYDIDNEVLQEVDWFLKGLYNSIIRKLKLTWELWTTGAVTAETVITMTEQQGLNYAETLKTAVEEVKNFRDTRSKKTAN